MTRWWICKRIVLLTLTCLTGCSSIHAVGLHKRQLQSTNPHLNVRSHSLERAVQLAAEQAYKDKNWADAQVHYARLLDKKPNNAQWLYRLANSLAHQGMYSAAIMRFERVLQLPEWEETAHRKSQLNMATTYLLGAYANTIAAHRHSSLTDQTRSALTHRLEVLGVLLK